MMMRRRELMMLGGGLPGAYRRVEYIKSDGYQYLITEYVPQLGDDLSIDIYADSLNPPTRPFFAGNAEARTGVVISGSLYWTYFAEGGAPSTSGFIDGSWSNIKIDSSGRLYMNNVLKGQDTRSKTPLNGSDNRLYLFQNSLNVGTATSTARISSMLVTNSGMKKLDLIPCVRKSDNKPGMYDTVSHTFYTNAGTGEFVVPN